MTNVPPYIDSTCDGCGEHAANLTVAVVIVANEQILDHALCAECLHPIELAVNRAKYRQRER